MEEWEKIGVKDLELNVTNMTSVVKKEKIALHGYENQIWHEWHGVWSI